MEPTLRSPYRAFERLVRGVVRCLDGASLLLRLDNAERLPVIARDDPTYGGYLMPFLRGLVTHSRGVMLLCATSGERSAIEHAMRELFLVSTVVALEPLDVEQTEELLNARDRRAFEVTRERAEQMWRLTGGHPWMLQALAHATCETLRQARRNTPTPDDVATAAALLLETPLAVYRVTWARLTVKARMLAALLAETDGPTSLAGLTRQATARHAPLLEEEVERLARDLVRDGYWVQTESTVDFAASLLRRFVAINHPADVVIENARESLGSYEILDTLGQGGMGVVHKARDMITGRMVALKVMARHLLSNDEAKRRFAREAALTMGLRHPNIVRTLDRGEHEGHTFIALEYLEGETLRERLRRDGRLPWRHAVAIAADIASALDEVHHANVIHRDIKSANIMLAGPSATPKLTDFGLAYGEDLSVMTQSGHLIGTMAYMSPEQVASGDAQPAWDLYGLGVVLYEMLTGVVPFAAKESLALMRAIAYEDVPPPTGKHADIPAAVAAVVMKMLAKAPSSRYPNAAEVEAALRALLA